VNKQQNLVADPLDVLARLLSFEGKQDPYPLYEEMRSHGSMVDLGSYVFATGYAECARALREPELLSTDGAVQDARLPGWREHASWRWLTKNMLFANEPDHERYRRFFTSAFSARAVLTRRPLVERLADEAVEHVAALAAVGEPVDLVPEFSFRLPMAVIGSLLGIPAADQPGMRALIGDITTALDPIGDLSELEPGDAGMERLSVYFYDLIARQRAAGDGTLTSDWLRACDADGPISEEELVANLMLLVVAATEATQDLLSNMVRLAIEYPGHGARLRDDPEAVADGFIDETLRFDPAVQVLNRVAAKDLVYFGVPVAEGTAITLLIAAANRDPRRFADPELFDPGRPDNQPLTMSGGPHFCLGAALARMSAEVGVPRLLRRFPRLALAGRPTFRDQIVQRGHDHLWIVAE
jgi:cytochrome P450